MQIIKGIVFSLVLLAAASAQVPCPTGPLTEEQLTTLVKGKVPEGRVRQFIASCGLKFAADEGAVKRLKAAGATAAELAALRAARQSAASEVLLKAEVELWEAIKNSRSEEAFQDYLRRYPDGLFVAAAKVKVQELGEAREEARRQEEARQQEAARRRELAERQSRWTEEYKRLKFEFVKILAGGFQMGSESGDGDEKPAHLVRITKTFELGRYLVTQAQWEAAMGSNPSQFKGADLPVETVSWNDVQEFLSKLNARKDGYRYRLPTEAEWEYAARAGTTGDNAGDLDSTAWYRENSNSQTHPVGQKQANAWGLHDMLGNVWEWCQDWYGENYYQNSPAEDPQGPSSGALRVLRGGTWVGNSRVVRVAYRGRNNPDFRNDFIGFRCAR